MGDVEEVLVPPDISIRQAMTSIDRVGDGIVLVVDGDRRLLGTVTDGDIRRAILRGVELDSPVATVMNRQPLVASPGLPEKELLRLMDVGKKETSVNQLPIVDKQDRVISLVLRSDLLVSKQLPISAVVMAGGLGNRLRPLTNELPKPMLPVGGRPILEWIIDGLKQAGVRHIVVTTHYKMEAITQHFGDGNTFGVQIEYVHENRLSGTAGALGLLQPWQQPLLIVNGDILTRVDFRAMLYYHQEHKADITVAVREYRIQVPYGIIEMNDVRIQKLTEKPSLPFFVNAGIYLLEPLVRDYINQGEFLDMPVLIGRLLHAQRSVVGFPIREYWIDVGQHIDYEQAQDDIRHRRL